MGADVARLAEARGVGRWRVKLGPIVLALCAGTHAAGHEGPPFPIVMDERAGPYIVSVWADPDIGDATFYVMVESESGGAPAVAPTVSLWVEPASGRLGRVRYPAEREAARGRLQFRATPAFDERDQWRVGIVLTGAEGRALELVAQVESTPPGYGAWDLAVYGAPFALVGVLWIVALARRRRPGAIRGDAQPAAPRG